MLFTGDLERDIITNPFFKAKEKNYLRAQIARISHATTLTPKGLYRSTEDNRIFMITIFSKGIRTMAK
jgi:radial spoke head protein 4A